MEQNNEHGDNVNAGGDVTKTQTTVNAGSDVTKTQTTAGCPKGKCSLSKVWWLSGFSILISVIAFCAAAVSEKIVVYNSSIILTFIGILSTFIVIGNYIQIKQAEDKVESLKKEMNTEIPLLREKIASLDQQISKINEIEIPKLRGLIVSLSTKPGEDVGPQAGRALKKGSQEE